MKHSTFFPLNLIAYVSFSFNLKVGRTFIASLLALLILSISEPLSAQGNDSMAQSFPSFNQVRLDDVSSGALLFQQVDSDRFLQAPQLKTTVDMYVQGIVANVKVKQTFTNSTDQWQHALYAFPLPDNAATNQLKIKLGERVIVGEIQEKKQALKTFNDAKQKGQKAALVQQYRPNLFTTDVANIPPQQSIQVELTYFQQVDYQAGEFSLHFPMAITPAYQPSKVTDESFNRLPNLIFQDSELHANSTKTGHLIDLNVFLSSGAPLAQLNSVNHDLAVTDHTEDKGSDNPQKFADYTLTLSNQVMDKEFKLIWKYQQNALPQVLNFQQRYQDNNYGLLMVLPGVQATKKQRNRQLTFIVDTSGSMSGQSMSQAKQAFKHALSSLTQDDSFQLISFNSTPTKLFASPLVATQAHKDSAWDYVEQLKADGGTEIMPALVMALQEASSDNEKLDQIVFLTDGAVGNEADIFSYIAQNISDKRLFTVGLGTAPNRYFMKKAAEIGRGSYQFISDPRELEKEMQVLFSKLSHPVLTDLQFSLNDSEASLLTAPNPIPDLYQDQPLFLSYQMADQQTASLLSARYQGEPWSLAIPAYVESEQQLAMVEALAPDLEADIPPLATLWARRKIADYFRDLMLYKSAQSKTDIIDLALQFHLVTPFTSLVAVEKQVSRAQGIQANAKQLKNNIPAGQKLPATALNWQGHFYLALLLLVFSTLLLYIASRKAPITINQDQ